MKWPFGKLKPRSFRTIVADPPWRFETRTPKGQERIEKHYDTMGLEQIIALPVGELAMRDAFLHLWVPGPLLVKGLHLRPLIAWGFTPVAMGFTWVKTKRSAAMWQLDSVNDFHFGNGYTTRHNAEFCVLAKRGKPQRASASVRELIVSQVREHSRKPSEFMDRVEQFYEGPYLELFARSQRPGWASWGNEVTKFDAS